MKLLTGKSMMLVFAALSLMLLCCSGNAFAQVNGLDLSGTWTAGNYGVFFIRQIGDEIWWFGEDDPIQPMWAQVGHGKMEGRLITVRWTNVPKGDTLLQGTVVFEATYPNRLVLRSQSGGGFGIKEMTKAKKGVECE